MAFICIWTDTVLLLLSLLLIAVLQE